jgi:hypothetical protein
MCDPRRPVHLRQRKDRPKANHKMPADTPQIGHQYLHIRTRDRLALNHQKWRCKRIVVVSSTSPKHRVGSPPAQPRHPRATALQWLRQSALLPRPLPIGSSAARGFSHVSPLLQRRCNTHRTQLSPYSNPFAVAIVPKMPCGILVAAIAQGEAIMTLRAVGVHPFTRTPCVGGRRRSRRDTVFIDVRIGCVVVALGNVLTQLKSA